MTKNLNSKEWVQVINIYKDKGFYEAMKIYCAITGFQTNYKYGIKEWKRRIKNKTILLDNNGMKALKRKAGSGRPKKSK